MLDKAGILSAKRQKTIPHIESNIKKLLAAVALPDAELKVTLSVEGEEKINAGGFDRVEFYFAANKGGRLQPMHKVASGGELSRLMLCIKSLISDKISLPSIVFDEIDTGISGEAALKVAQVLKQHATRHQVLAITHLPQIAAKGDTHFNVYKTLVHNSTQTHIKKLSDDERMAEIARMLAGNNPSEKVMTAAKEMMWE
jgi:DNA repair protein RecN (Recombination protein N)